MRIRQFPFAFPRFNKLCVAETYIKFSEKTFANNYQGIVFEVRHDLEIEILGKQNNERLSSGEAFKSITTASSTSFRNDDVSCSKLCIQLHSS